MQKDYIGTIYTKVSDDFQRGLYPIARCLKAETHDLATVEIIKLGGGDNADVKVIGQMDNTIDNTFESANRVYDSNGIAPTINTCGGGDRQPKILEVKQLGYVENGTGKHQSNTVYDTDGICPGITTVNGGGTQQIKILEIKSLRMTRTEEGKRLRKAYESGKIHHGFNEYREAEPREDGLSNTITTVQKDNIVLETKCLNSKGGRNGIEGLQPSIQDRVYDTSGISTSITTSYMPNILEQKIVAMRGRNPDNPSDRTVGVPTEQRLEMQTEDICNALTSVQKDNLVLEITQDIDEKFHKFLYLIDGELYLIRIRKLTPLECWRLMDFSDEDFRKAEEVNSNTQLYRQAGNSIVVNVLTAIFGQMIEGKENRYKEV